MTDQRTRSRPVRHLLLRLPAPFFVVTGALHFVWPDAFARAVPDYLPAHHELVYASGIAEILGGLSLIPHGTRRAAGWSLVGLLVAVFPANVWMAQHPERFNLPGGRATLLARLPLQLVLIAWVRAASQRD
jgi:uncharacterized membrane protein